MLWPVPVPHRLVVGWCLVVILIVLTSVMLAGSISGVVVDGEKKKDLSALLNQSDEKTSIDSFNLATCGIADPNFEEHEFINMAREGQFPWMVSFQIHIPKNSTKSQQEQAAKESDSKVVERETGKSMEDLHFCAGAFISDKWILSAAHCFASSSMKTYLEHGKLQAVAGSYRVSASAPMNRRLPLKRIYFHSAFDRSLPVGYDVALVELAQPVEFRTKRRRANEHPNSEPFINAICLPLKDKHYKTNETARIAGWGMSRAGDESSQPSKLLTTDILLGDLKKCADQYAKSMHNQRLKEILGKQNDYLCANYKDTRDACQADSGGPLIEYASDKAVAVGIVSYGIGCATKGVPGIYTRTSAYIGWIRDITRHGKQSSVAFNMYEIISTAASTTTTTTTEPPSSTTSTTKRRSTTSTTDHSAHSTTTSEPKHKQTRTTTKKPDSTTIKPNIGSNSKTPIKRSTTTTTQAAKSTTSTTSKSDNSLDDNDKNDDDKAEESFKYYDESR